MNRVLYSVLYKYTKSLTDVGFDNIDVEVDDTESASYDAKIKAISVLRKQERYKGYVLEIRKAYRKG